MPDPAGYSLKSVTIAVPQVATQLPSTNYAGGASIQADPGNADGTYVRYGQAGGVGAASGFALGPGDSAHFIAGNLSTVWVFATAPGCKLTYGGEGR